MDANFMNVVAAVEQEIERAKSLHPGDFHNAHEGYAVLLEEVDELWENVKLNPKKIDATGEWVVGGDYKLAQRQIHCRRMREEAIQVAAMAIRFAAEVC